MSVTAPAGFRAAGVTAGLKASGDPDVALVVNDGPENAAAGVFTTNKVVAAPVRWSRQVLRWNALRAAESVSRIPVAYASGEKPSG